ncbi:MAG TPA: DUF1887 family CARF protein [Syntrophorhabdaceae bacterium]|nr:DUF1887 family protein [Syntrophorhabdaceae bacterium]MDI9560821.1 DUF1887 family CARF protein [Pseudomonadota bacterium]HPM11855.1 DUF1887 family CARF protein [Paludibacter sp.]HPN98698.1 DUF1887 family CARF protein [Syntrophorhabdaceae bacterium]HQJ95312.1 DUF1887 family CARF protein [Syntrophorhabdaceae bacterium]
MNHVHICLVSDQTIPNILGIYHFKPDMILFITTKEMEKKGKTTSILDVMEMMGFNYENRHKKIIVLGDSILDCHRKIDEAIQEIDESEFSVNLTNGTKIMSIAAYDYFKDYGSKMIYIPINKNEYITPFPKKAQNKPELLGLRVSVSQYLAAYGLKVSNSKNLEKYSKEALERKELSRWIAENYSDIINLLVVLGGALRIHRDDEKDYLCQAEFENPTRLERELMARMNMHYSGKNLSKLMTRSEIRYITGGWLEEFCFCELHHYLNSGIDDIKTGLKLKNRKGTENEFDVMFTMDNALYFVECKTLEQQNLDYKDILYKIGALQQDFGLRVNSFWVTTSSGIMKNDELKPAVEARAAQFNTVIVPPKDVPDFGKIVAKKLKLENHNNIKIEQ